MSAVSRIIVTAFMTPRDLREIANFMENRWKVKKLGESLVVKTWAGNTTSIEFAIDQERMAGEPVPTVVTK